MSPWTSGLEINRSIQHRHGHFCLDEFQCLFSLPHVCMCLPKTSKAKLLGTAATGLLQARCPSCCTCTTSKRCIEQYTNTRHMLVVNAEDSAVLEILICQLRKSTHGNLTMMKVKGSVKELNILIYFFFSAHHSITFCFRCSVYWWKGSVRFKCFKILLVKLV